MPRQCTLISPHLIYLPAALGSLDERALALLLLIIQIVSVAYHGRGPGYTLYVLLLVRHQTPYIEIRLDVKMVCVIASTLRVNVLAVLYRVVRGDVPLLGVK